MHRLIVVLMSLLSLVVAGGIQGAVAVAQDASPAAGAQQFPLVADPALCTGEPRDTEELLNLWFPEDGTPTDAPSDEMPAEVTIPLGPRIEDEAIIAAVTTTVHQVFSCFAAGDVARAYALFTDDLAIQFGPEPGTTREDAQAFVEASPMPEDPEQQTRILAVTDVMQLEDGRVGAFAVDEVGTAYVIFEQVGDRWLVDEVIEFSTGDE
jgi:hypothetical protein